MRRILLVVLLCASGAGAQDFIRYYPPAPAAGMLDPGSDGFMVRTAVDTSAARSLTSPLGTLAIGNADGVAANPTLDVDTSIIGQFSSGAGTAPATCVQGDFYYETDTFFVTACPATDTPKTLINMAETSTSGFGFVIDEDSFATDSATKVPTQQSTKAYIAAQIAAVSGGMDLTTAVWTDDFFNSGATTGIIGELGWTFAQLGSAGTVAQNDTGGWVNHPGVIRLGTGTNDNGGPQLALTTLATGDYGSEDWDMSWIIYPEDAVTSTYISVGMSAGTMIAATSAIRAIFDTDHSHATWIFQVCDSDSDGCQSAGDDTNADTVASTKAPTAATWQRVRIRRATSGVGGNPTIYFSVGDGAAMEVEKTFCSAACDEDLGNIPTGIITIKATIVARAAATAKDLLVDRFDMTESGLVRY